MLSDQSFSHRQLTPALPTQPKRRIEVRPEVEIGQIMLQGKGIFTFTVLPRKISNIPVYQKYTEWRFAKILMGQNFYGPEEFEEEFPLYFLAPEELRKIAHVPWTKEILESPCPFFEGKMVKETHFLTMNQVFHSSGSDYWFEWNLVVKNPPFIKPSELPASYGIRKAVESGEDIIREIIARYPQK